MPDWRTRLMARATRAWFAQVAARDGHFLGTSSLNNQCEHSNARLFGGATGGGRYLLAGLGPCGRPTSFTSALGLRACSIGTIHVTCSRRRGSGGTLWPCCPKQTGFPTARCSRSRVSSTTPKPPLFFQRTPGIRGKFESSRPRARFHLPAIRI